MSITDDDDDDDMANPYNVDSGYDDVEHDQHELGDDDDPVEDVLQEIV